MLIKALLILIALLSTGELWFEIRIEIENQMIIIKISLNLVNCARRRNKTLINTEICDLKKMDRNAEIVFVFGRRDVYLPKNLKEMVPHCEEEFKGIFKLCF